MRSWIYYIAVFLLFSGRVVCATQCHDLHLVNGTVIPGIQYEVEEVYGNRYIVYHYVGDTRVQRINHSQVEKITPGECGEKPPVPTPSSPVPETENRQKSPQEFWKKILDIMEDSNPVRRNYRWKTVVKNRRITLCGEVTGIVPGRKRYRINLITRGPGNLSENPMAVEAFLPGSQAFRLSKIDIGQIVCVNGKITRSRHMDSGSLSSQPGYENYRLMEELEMMLEPERLLIDFVLEGCRIESINPEQSEPVEEKPEAPKFQV